MRDAFGSTFMLRLIIIFIVFYVCFATIAVSYAKTFRLKNTVIDIVEQYQYSCSKECSGKKEWNRVISQKVDTFLANSNYNYKDKVKNSCTTSGGEVSEQGACIQPIEYTLNKKKRHYYKVTLYIIIHLPAINWDAVIPVSGETRDYT